MGGARLACFDLDNTLIDRGAAYLSWAREFAGRRGLDQAAVELLVELDRDGFATRAEVFGPARARLGLAEGVEELVAAYRIDYPRHVAPVPEVASGLARLREAGVRVALVTNGPPSQCDKLVRAGLEGCFDAVCISELLGVAKPDRAIFAAAAERCGTALSKLGRGWMVGDQPEADVAGGHGAGLETLWVRRGRRFPGHLPAPDREVDGALEALAYLLDEAGGVAGG